MIATTRPLILFAEEQGRSWLVRAVLVVVCIAAVVRAAGWWEAESFQRDREEILRGEAAERLSEAVSEFAAIQQEAFRIAQETASRPQIRAALTSASERREELFSIALDVARDEGVGVEIFDRTGRLAAWGGRSGSAGPEVATALRDSASSGVRRESGDARLFVVVPVRAGGEICGALLVRRVLETSAPFASRDLNGPGLTARLEERLGTAVEFSFSPRLDQPSDGRFLSATLAGIDGRRIGSVRLLRPGPAEVLERRMERYDRLERMLLLLLIVLGTAWGWRNGRGALLRIALLWGARYALILLDLPSSIIRLRMFDPIPFAAKFGGGLARSIGDLTLTVVVAGVSTVLLCALLLRRTSTRPTGSVYRFLLVAIPSAALLLWAFRGYAAAIRSGVFDSSIELLDPRTIFPSLDLSLMLVNLLALGGGLLLLSGALCVRILSLWGEGEVRPRHWRPFGVLLLLLLGAALGFGLVSNTPLAGLELRLLFVVGVSAVTLMMVRGERNGRVLSPGIVGGSVLAAALLLYPLLELAVAEHDRGRIETMGQGVVRPVDRWFSLVVEEGLRSFMDEDVVRVIREGDENEIARIAYTRWMRNPASREGYTSIFTYFDASGYVRSRFAIGGQLAVAVQVDTSSLLDNVREVEVRTIGRGANVVKVYQGLTDIPAPEGGLLGFGQVTLAAGQQTLFRGETPVALRAGTGGSLQTFYRPVFMAEFKEGNLQPFATGIFSRGTTLPEGIARELPHRGPEGVWGTVEQEERYETLYLRRPGTKDEVVAISIAGGGMAARLIGVVVVVLHAAVLSAFLLIGGSIAGWVRGGRVRLTFRGKLLAGMVLTALVPLVLLSLYGSAYTTDRLLEESRRTLEDEAKVVASALYAETITSAQAETIASEINTDFTLFVSDSVRATSRPELFDLSLLDRRLSGGAHSALILGGREFLMERETIGKTEYAIGYRPVVDSTGKTAAVIAVPTLFRQDRLEEESTRRNAVLFGVYILVLAGVLLIATTLSNRIAAPLRELTDATRRVAAGDLSAAPVGKNADPELRELIDAFGVMTRDLARSRGELMKVERELAWKEMAQQVAHEIKNPLTPMRLSVQHLRQAYRDGIGGFGEVLEKVGGTLLEQIEALNRIASEFSHFARMPRRRVEACPVPAVLQESVQLFAPDQGVTFEVRAEDGIAPVMADRDELRRAFINVIRNGIQAMEGRGRIEVAASARGREVVVTIRDHGKGIADEARRRLFEPNFSTKTDGMGLGLAIVRKTIEDLGGTIGLDDATGGGTVATIVLPAGGEG